MDARVPAVEVADDADPLRVGRPHRELHAVGLAVADRPGAEGLVGALVRPFAPQVAVELAEDGAVAIGVVDHGDVAVMAGDPEAIVERGHRRPDEMRLEDAVVVHPGHRRRLAAGLIDDLDRTCPGMDRADDHLGRPVRTGVQTEHGERIAMAAGSQRVQLVEWQQGTGHRGHPDLIVVAARAAERYDRAMTPGLYARFVTSEGPFTVRLFEKETPKTVANFVALAEGTKEWTDPATRTKASKPFYDGLIFHRVIPDFMIQGGCPMGNGMGDPGYKFADEFAPGLRHDKPGILSMANSGPNTNGSQFFVTLVPTPWLDNRHTVFGEVVEGMDVINAIGKTPTRQDRPVKDIRIESLKIERV